MPVARNTDPGTSHAAAASVDGLTEKQRCVLDVLRTNGPLTDEELAGYYADYEGLWPDIVPHQSDSGLRTRRKELCDQGLVRALPPTRDNLPRPYPEGMRLMFDDVNGWHVQRRLASGRWGIVWEAVSGA